MISPAGGLSPAATTATALNTSKLGGLAAKKAPPPMCAYSAPLSPFSISMQSGPPVEAAVPCMPVVTTNPREPFQMRIGAEMPDFLCETTKGPFTFHEYLVNDPARPWTVFFSYPQDFAPVCTEEIGRLNSLFDEFTKRGVKLLGISSDSLEEHSEWTADILALNEGGSNRMTFPIISDLNRDVLKMLGWMDAEEDLFGNSQPARGLVVITPQKKVRCSMIYPTSTGRNFDELLRLLDSLLLTEKTMLLTGPSWKPGEKAALPTSVSSYDAPNYKGLSKEELPSGRDYYRHVDTDNL